MVKIDDITLMAFADGELSEAEAQKVSTAIAQDPKMAATVNKHKLLKESVNIAFDKVDDHPLPTEITSLLNNLKDTEQPPKPFWKFSSLTSHLQWFLPAYATATIITIAFIGLTIFTTGTPNHKSLPNTVASVLDSTLNRTTDNTKTPHIHVGETYQKNDGTLCRTFRFNDVSSPKKGLACRTSTTEWSTVAIAPVIPDNVYLPAGEETGTTINTLTSKMTLLPEGSESSFLK